MDIIINEKKKIKEYHIGSNEWRDVDFNITGDLIISLANATHQMIIPEDKYISHRIDKNSILKVITNDTY